MVTIGEGRKIGEIGVVPGTNEKVYIAEKFPRITLICGRQRSGKTFCTRVLIEELSKDPKNHFVILDPKSEFSFQHVIKDGYKPPSERVYSNEDGTLKLKFSDMDFSSLTKTLFSNEYQPSAILFESVLKRTKEEKGNFTPGDAIVSLIKYWAGFGVDEELAVYIDTLPKAVKNAVLHRLRSLDNMGVFTANGGITVKDLLETSVTRIVIHDTPVATKIVLKGLIGRILQERQRLAEKYIEMDAKGIRRPEWHRIILVVEEAHLYSRLPEIINYVKIGGYAALGGIFISQRPVSVSPEVTSQINAIMIFKLVSDRDIEWVRRNSPVYIPPKYIEIFKKLDVGECIVAASGKEDILTKIKIREAYTYHYGKSLWV